MQESRVLASESIPMHVDEADLEYGESELCVDIHDRHICCRLFAALRHRERENVLRATPEACTDSIREKCDR
jgi:hypothetical protein